MTSISTRGGADRHGVAATGRGRLVGRTARLAMAGLVGVLAAACAAPKPAVTPGPGTYPDYVFPQVPPDLQRLTSAVRGHERGWAFLQSGDLRNADRAFAAVLKRAPDFYPALAATGYLELARRNPEAALRSFDRSLGRAAAYVPALVGRADALLGLGRTAEALSAFETALDADPSLADIRRRVEVLRFGRLQETIAAAQAAVRDGRMTDARAAYLEALAASPESTFLYRELAAVERKLGDRVSATSHLREAIARDAADGTAHVLLGELLEEEAMWEEAVRAYERAKALDASPDLDARIARVNERLALARLPVEYHSIASAARVTRGDLAALIGIRLEDAVRAARRDDAVLVTDVRGHWALPWIENVTRAGFMEVYSNHTFQPGSVVRRSDLAQAASRVLGALTARDPSLGRSWHGVSPGFSDIGPGHLGYPAAAMAVAARVMGPDGEAFRPSRPVSGAEAIETISRLEALASRISHKESR
jgi:tetratricopeptide (TPR) repeat protein